MLEFSCTGCLQGMQAPMGGPQAGMFHQGGMPQQQMMNQPRPAQPGGANDPFGAL